jgi:hypothetical protein
MSLLYKKIEEQTLQCEIEFKEGKFYIEFSSDCGKFGTIESLQGYILTPERLMQILHDREDYTDEEL